ncbi:acyltransferase family protein [Arenimonas sp.]|uniref:acyltransferase family protein n=1 Tax=Arenimonas sp. TaxID=1872635 RepID=UPI0035B19565
MKFNPGIEGLRGIAILLVVLAHAGVPGMAAGFIGVDVFFVISGFLITGLLTEELKANGKVDYWAFFARRARRLAPALLLMVAMVSTAVIALIPKSAWGLHLDSGFWSLLWASNIYFTFAGYEYFGPSATESLFLHTWSLGVEEQFYLVWPFLLAWGWTRGGQGWRGLAILTTAGFIVGLFLLWLEASAGYYLMPSRLWQLAAGGVAWRLWSSRPAWLAGREGYFGWSGLVLLGVGTWLIDGGHSYPGWLALMPTLGSTCLLLSVANGAAKFPVLQSAPLLLAGRVSYGWYLWHWPLLFLPLAIGWAATPAQRLFAVLLSFLVALASFAWLEQPVRRRRGHARTAVFVAVAASLIVASAIHLAPALLGPGFLEQRDLLEARIRENITVPGIYMRPGCDQWYHSDELVPCEYAPSGPDVPTVVFFGDSVGGQWLPAIERVVESQSLKLVVLTKSSCPMVDEPFHYARINRRFTECETWRRAALEHIRTLDPEWVILGSSQYDYSPGQWREGSRRILASIVDGGSRAVVLAPTPILDFHVPQCLATSGRIERGRVMSEQCSQPLAAVDPVDIIGYLREATAGVPGSSVLYLNDRVCAGGVCRGVVDGRVTYRDGQHLNAAYVEDLAFVFQRRLDEALREENAR